MVHKKIFALILLSQISLLSYSQGGDINEIVRMSEIKIDSLENRNIKIREELNILKNNIDSLKNNFLKKIIALEGFYSDQMKEIQQLNKSLNTKLNNSLPVGTIIAYSGQLYNLPKDWMLCDGILVEDKDSPLYQKRVPDLVGFFIRGTNRENELNLKGGQDKILSTNPKLDLDYIYVKKQIKENDKNIKVVSDIKLIDNREIDNRPDNKSFYYIIKIK